MAGWYHRFNGHELGQTSGDIEGQGGLACCSPWGCKESDRTEQQHIPDIAKCFIRSTFLILMTEQNKHTAISLLSTGN